MGALFDKPAFLIALIVLIVLLFGAKRLPDLSRSVGRSLRIFKAETEGLRGDGTSSEAPSTTPTPGTALPAAPPAAAPAVSMEAPRYLVDPVTGERVLAQPVPNPPTQG